MDGYESRAIAQLYLWLYDRSALRSGRTALLRGRPGKVSHQRPSCDSRLVRVLTFEKGWSLLTHHDQQILLLIHRDGMLHSEVAELFGLNRRTVSYRISVAHESLVAAVDAVDALV